jgi:hypothetical protein
VSNYIESAKGFLGDLRLMLFATVGSGVLLFFPESHTPPGVASFIASYLGWIWSVFVLSLTGLLTRTISALISTSGAGLRAVPERI